jgi:hypothetical protein
MKSGIYQIINIREARESLDTTANHITEVCQGKRKSSHGFGWKYLPKGEK